jgi:hypothetical protein
MTTMTVIFRECGGDRRDITVPNVELHEGDEIDDVVNRAAAMHCPADTVDHEWQACPDLDDNDGECTCADDCCGEGFFFRDNGLSTCDTWYGQIFRPVSKRMGTGNAAVTPRVCVDVAAIRAELA